MSRIAVEFSGWIVGEPEEYRFQAIEEGIKPVITGVEYCSLSEEQRDSYILEDLAGQISKSFDSNWENITVEVDDE